jgi:hypothetical protein
VHSEKEAERIYEKHEFDWDDIEQGEWEFGFDEFKDAEEIE